MATLRFKISGGLMEPEIEIPLSSTIFDLKSMISSILNVEIERQTLYYNKIRKSGVWKGYKLEDDQTIESYHTTLFKGANFIDQVALVLTPLPEGQENFNIIVKYTKQITVEVTNFKRVKELKKEIEDLSGIPSEKMMLIHAKMEMVDRGRMYDYYLRGGSVVEVIEQDDPDDDDDDDE